MNQLYALPRPRSHKPHPVWVVCWLLGLLSGDHSVAQISAFPFPQIVVYTNGVIDGELDVSLALAVADKQWGGYQSAAVSLINKIKTCETTIANGLHILKPGDAFGRTGYTNASYFSPAYYRVFATIVPTGTPFWQNRARDIYSQLAANANPITGLLSNWQRASNGTPSDAGCGANFAFQGRRYSYDATRTPWCIGIDYLWGHTDPKLWLDKLTTFVKGSSVSGIANAQDGYGQNGSPTGQFYAVPIVGGFAVAAMASRQTTAHTFTTDLKAINLPFNSYLDSSLRALCMLALTGNFWNRQRVRPRLTARLRSVCQSLFYALPINN